MAYFIHGYPYSDTHNLNLDWVIDTLKRIATEVGELHYGLEIHVTDTSGTEIYTFTVKDNGIYITRPDGGTPLFYNFNSQTLHAPYFDGQSFLFASGRATGQLRAGSLVLDNALPIAQGGSGDTEAVNGTITSTHENVTVSEVRLRRWGRVVSVSGYLKSTSALDAYTTLFTLPEGFRSLISPVVNTTIVNASTGAQLPSYTGGSGTFQCRNAISANVTYWFGFSFVM